MEEKQTEEKQGETASHSNPMIWVGIAAVVIIIAIVYFARSGYKSPSPASTPSTPAAAPSASQSSGSASGEVKAGATTVTVKNFAFSPATLQIKKGDTVTWTNEDSAPHQIASDTNAFQGTSMSQGQTYSFTFNTAGNFPYHCAIHPSMKGMITVQ